MENDKEKAIRQICMQLTPTLLLSTPSRWRAVEDEDQLANNTGISAKDRVVQNAKVVTDWVQVEVPKQLQSLKQLMEGIPIDHFSIQLRALIAITVSKFISYRKAIAQPFSINVWTSSERYLFTSPENGEIASRILRLPIFSESNDTLPLDVVDTILQSYIRPLFSTTPSASINESSGRAKQKSKMHTAGSGPREDEIVWKGGDPKRSAQMKCLGQDMLITKDGSTPLQSRHMGIGAESVLFACCKSIEAAPLQDGDTWDRYSAEILPPLFQLLEDPSPRYRLAGTQILSTTLLAGYKDPSRRLKVESLLLRTGLADLIRSIFEINFTFISVQISGALLQSTAEAFVKLMRITTEDLVINDDPSPAHVVSDGGRARFEQFSLLVENGVLRVWAFAPSTTTLFEIGEDEQAQNRAEGDEYEDVDVIDASIEILKQAAQSDNLGTGIVRYLDVTLEFLMHQLSGIQDKLQRAREKKLNGNGKVSLVNLHREIVSAEAVLSILQASSDCPYVEDWCGKCILICAQCWFNCRNHYMKGPHSARLDEVINSIVGFFRQHYAATSYECLQSIAKIDDVVFKEFVDLHV
ncbi:uncharacterized protein FA14DRAFT_160277 [Meira miltonrushii]|uniref:Uncharacterized protein n=1 Tax=Meira miltonrushii TaxID=1280837 RepID=A0A316VFS4_9BASI|nr:uncharacterized protein FA14DRAFT_160277 [Meira miltonrushii]PWN34851.1 hypothetical protein FA14DRAFT_160277 [Meira miltonrushii]